MKLSWNFPKGFYRDKPFICKDCGAVEIWKAWQQKWWYEQRQGDPDSTAVRCRACRIRERERKTEARHEYFHSETKQHRFL
ncbi:MAG: zinc-ribbon domain-containing protein [Azoarcus sp.]|nr:zinc-ribbon domain-containing protein [Azoarcus sp.]